MEQHLKSREELLNSLINQKYEEISFSTIEEKANQVFINLVDKERSSLEDTFYKIHTLRHQEQIKHNSNLYKALLKLPKGGVLHIHTDCCHDIDWFM